MLFEILGITFEDLHSVNVDLVDSRKSFSPYNSLSDLEINFTHNELRER